MDSMISAKSLSFIQQCLSSVPVIVLGSGASAAYGLAGMAQLAQHLVNSISPEPVHLSKWNELKRLLASGVDLETALHQVAIPEPLEKKIINSTRELILQQDMDAFHSVLSGDIRLPLGELLQYLRRTTHQTITVVTTNYDRLAEYAIEQAGLNLNMGFSGQYYRQFNRFQRQPASVELLKVHGSLDWFSNNDNVEISLPDMASHQDASLSPLMVTPGIRKYEHTHHDPFRTIITKADAAFDTANSILCVGYGFNDTHIQPKLINRLRQGRIPIVIAARSLTASAAKFIKSATASNVIGIEKYNQDTRIMHRDGEEIVENRSFWSFDELIKLVM